MLVKRPRSLAIDSRAVELEVRAARVSTELDADLVAIAIADGDALPDGAPRRAAAPRTSRPASRSSRSCIPSVRRVRWSSGSAAARRSTPSACGWPRRSVAARAGALDAPLARLGRCPRPAIARARCRARRGHGLAAYRFDRYRSRTPRTRRRRRLERLVIGAGATDRERIEAEARVALGRRRGGEPRPRAPEPALERAHPRARSPRAPRRSPPRTTTVKVEVLDREAIAAKGMGGLVAVSQGSRTEPRLIVLRYGGGGDEPRSGWSARRSPSTAAGSRSSPRRAWRR